MPDAQLQMVCEGCGTTVLFPAKDHGTVQECPQCGAYLDLPEITRTPTIYDTWSERYERHLAEADKIQAHEVELIARAEQLISRWEQIAERMERFLNRLDTQDQR